MGLALFPNFSWRRPPLGEMILAGGGPTCERAADRFLQSCGRDALIVVIPLATEEPLRDRTAEYLRERGARNVVTFAIAQPTEGDLEELADLLSRAKGLWMPGGSQRRLRDRLGLEWAQRHIGAAVRRGITIYGTSAGAMILSRIMIAGPGTEPDTVRMGKGLGLVSWVVDTHFRERRREPRLRDALRRSDQPNGLGISETSWVLMRGDKILETHGGVMRIEGVALASVRERVQRLPSLRQIARKQLLRGGRQLALPRSVRGKALSK